MKAIKNSKNKHKSEPTISIQKTKTQAPSHSNKKRATDLVVIGGKEYGTGSSRDWAAKGTKLLGIKVVIAESFERIHRSNLIGMGILPLQFLNNVNRKNLNLLGSELISVLNIEKGLLWLAKT